MPHAWSATSHGCAERLAGLGVRLRPHLKTAKSVEVARRVMDSPRGPATVSTLKEAEQFAAAGVTDIIYAVGIAPAKLAQVLALRAEGVDLAVILDTVAQAEAVAAASRAGRHAHSGADRDRLRRPPLGRAADRRRRLGGDRQGAGTGRSCAAC